MDVCHRSNSLMQKKISTTSAVINVEIYYTDFLNVRILFVISELRSDGRQIIDILPECVRA